jgi:uncharacterized protein YpbB
LLHIESIILYSLRQINGERTIYSIYHLLNGKKSSQTIQDAHLFSLKKYFRIVESLTREHFDQLINHLLESEMITSKGDGRFLLTEKGEQQINRNLPLHFLNGWNYHGFTTVFWERLTFFVQVISNIVYHESHYIPIQKNKEIHSWLKSVIKEIEIPRFGLGPSLYSEISTCLEEAADINPLVIIARLTGYRQIGLTAQQTAKKLNMEMIDYHIEFISILHYLIQKVQNNRERFSLLSCLIQDQDTRENHSLTLSAKRTLELLQQGYSKDQISLIRKLKLSTIEDHLVELALNVSDFSIDDYVELDLQKKIINISLQSATKELKVIRNILQTVSYFQIRLVLAKQGDQ